MAYSLSCDDFNEMTTEGMHDLLHTGHLADVTFAIDGKIFKAHKTVLALYSPYFRELFMSNPHPHPLFFMHGVKHHIMRDLLSFIYMGKVQIEEADLGDFVATATSLQVQGLNRSKAVPSPPLTLPSIELPSGGNQSHNNMTNAIETPNTTGDASSDPLSPSIVQTFAKFNKAARKKKHVLCENEDENLSKKHKVADDVPVVTMGKIVRIESRAAGDSLNTSFDIKDDTIELPDQAETLENAVYVTNATNDGLVTEDSTVRLADSEDEDWQDNDDDDDSDDSDVPLQVLRRSAMLSKQSKKQQKRKCSQKGKPVKVIEQRNDKGMLRTIIIDGHRYHYSYKLLKNNEIVYYCTKVSSDKKCTASAIVYADNFMKRRGTHNHCPQFKWRSYTNFHEVAATYYV